MEVPATELKDDHFGGPFNGQIGRQILFTELEAAVGFRAVVETGTFTGSTTEFMHRWLRTGEVYTCEVSSSHFEFARKRLGSLTTVHVENADSRAFLRRFATRQTPGPVFYYLDAHWRDDLPLFEELEIIRTQCPAGIVMIDDFKHPTDDGYTYYVMDEKRSLTLECVAAHGLTGFAAFAPTWSSRVESGYRRGCVLLTWDDSLAAKMSGMASLSRVDLSGGLSR